MIATTLRTVWSQALSQPKADFLVLPNRRYRYADLTAAIGHFAHGYDARGVVTGDRVLIASTDEFASIVAFVAALLQGIVPVLVAADTKSARANGIRAQTDPALVVADMDLAQAWGITAPVMSLDLPQTPGVFGRLRAGGKGAPYGGLHLPQTDDGLAYLMFTSGTTDAPTGVAISRRNLFANIATVARMLQIGPDSRVFNDMVLAHADGLIQGPVLALFQGASVIRGCGFSLAGLEDWLNLIRRHSATHFITVPTVWAMIDRYARHDDYFDAPEMKALISCAAKLEDPLWLRLQTRFKRAICNEYGLTETVMSALYAGPFAGMGPSGTIGMPVDCEAKVAARDPAQPDIGELLLRGDSIFTGYWRAPGRTAQAFTHDGWLKTGDIAQKNLDGSYSYQGRMKSIINSGGLLIRPEEIDEVLLQCPRVIAAVTLGLPDADFGEIAVSAVELSGDITEAALTEFAAARLEALKIPKRIVPLASIPRGQSGKPKLQDLRQVLGDIISAAQRQQDGGTGDLDDQVFQIAASVFRCDAAGLDARSDADTVKGWDSFSFLGLILALEDQLGLHLPARHVAGMKNLGDVIEVVQGLKP